MLTFPFIVAAARKSNGIWFDRCIILLKLLMMEFLLDAVSLSTRIRKADLTSGSDSVLTSDGNGTTGHQDNWTPGQLDPRSTGHQAC